MDFEIESQRLEDEYRESPAALKRYEECVDLWRMSDCRGTITVDELSKLSRLATPDQACREAMAALNRDRVQRIRGSDSRLTEGDEGRAP